MNKESKEYLAQYEIGKDHGIHVIQTTFNQYELKRYGLPEVIKYHADRLGISDRYKCHVDFNN